MIQQGPLKLFSFLGPKDFLEPRSPALQADSLPAEPQGKPRNTGVGSLSLLQQIFPTQVFLLLLLLLLSRFSHVRLCNSMDYTVHDILQARILEWVAIPFSRGSS